MPVERIERVIEHVEFADDRMRIGVEQELVGVEAVADQRLVGAVHAPAIELSRFEPLHVDMPDVAGSVPLRVERDAVRGLDVVWSVEKIEKGLFRILGVDGEIDAFCGNRGPERRGMTWRGDVVHLSFFVELGDKQKKALS